MTATSVAASATMINPFAAPTAGSSVPTVNPFAPKPDNKPANPFASGDAGTSHGPKKAAMQGSPFALSSDSENNRKTTNPFASGNRTNTRDGNMQTKKFGDPTTHASTGASGFGDAQFPRKAFPENARGPGGQLNFQKRPGSSSSNHSSDGEGTHRYRRSNDPHAINVYGQLRRDAIHPPKWPSRPGNPETKAEMGRFRDTYEEYRSRVRASLTKAKLIDDPNERKKLSDALNFRGICEEMCPDFEKITRIAEGDIQGPERDPKSKAPNPRRMIKRLARSAAGQEAPLPMDVRSIACLKRTLDYLMDDILQKDENLQSLHGFLWDRTRAIRRDFTFFSSLAPEELQTQIYCLENITRFHVTAYHLVFKDGKKPEAFSDQQEMEQLGKALLTLRDLYDDCESQGMTCENEAEFRAYYLLFHAKDPSILEKVQRQWRPSLWKDSDVIRTAVSLVEALQNTSSFHGPLAQAPFLAASNSLGSYFRIVASPQVSYTMACFAELHFPELRRTILSAVKGSMSRPKGQALDVTVGTLNKFLQFDTLQEVIDLAEQLDISVVPAQEAPTDVDRQVVVLDGKGSLPHQRLKHQFSQKLVEKKRSRRPLPMVIHQTVFEESKAQRAADLAGEESLFVQDKPPTPVPSTGSVPSPANPATTHNPFTSLAGTGGLSKGQSPGELPNNTPFSTFGPKPSTASVLPVSKVTPSLGTISTPKPAEAVPATSTLGQQASVPKPSPFGSTFASTTNASNQNPVFSGKLSSQASASGAPGGPSVLNTSKPAFNFSPIPSAPAPSVPQSQREPGPLRSITGPTTDLTPTTQTGPSSTSTLPQGTNPGQSHKPPSSFSGLPSSNATAPSQTPFQAVPPAQPAKPSFIAPTASSDAQSQPSAPTSSAAVGLSMNSPSQAQSQTAEPQLPSSKPSKRDLWKGITKWYVLADNGLMEDFQAYIVEDKLKEVYDKFVEEQQELIRKEEEERLLREARRFRTYNLSVKFFYRWRENARQKRLKNLRRNGRDQMKKYYEAQRAEEARAKKEAAMSERRQKAKEALRNRPEEMLENLRQRKTSRLDAEEALLASSVLAGVSDEREQIARLVSKEYEPPVPERLGRSIHRSVSRPPSRSVSGLPAHQLSRPSSRQSTRSISSSTASRSTSKTDKLRAELSGARPQGFRRSLPPMVASNRSSRAASSSGVSERWRLKAMGIVQMPDGTAMPEFLAHEVQHRGRPVAGMLPPARRASMTGIAMSDRESMPPPPLTMAQREMSPNKRKRESNDSEGSIKATSHKRVMSEAEKVIAELRAMREEMEEGTSWFKSQNERLQSEFSSRGTTPWDDET